MGKAWPHHTPTLIWNERSDGKSPGITCSVSHVRKKVKVQLRSSPSNECICGKSVNMILRSAAVRPPNNTHHFLNEPWCGFIFERIWRCAAEISLSKPIDGKLLTEDFIHVLNKGMHYSFIHWVTHTHTHTQRTQCLFNQLFSSVLKYAPISPLKNIQSGAQQTLFSLLRMWATLTGVRLSHNSQINNSENELFVFMLIELDGTNTTY